MRDSIQLREARFIHLIFIILFFFQDLLLYTLDVDELRTEDLYN